MKRTAIAVDFSTIPTQFHPFLQGAAVFDSSCSPAARVYFLDKGPGFYLKTAPKGTLAREALMTRFFHSKGLAAEVLAYECLDADWLLTRRLPGEDCLYRPYLDDPKRLCDTTAQLLRMLHETNPAGCPIPDRTAEYLATARRNHQNKNQGIAEQQGPPSGHFSISFIRLSCPFRSNPTCR
jgi:kanamycin kinase